MHNWFQCKIKYEKNAEDGGVIKVSEAYLVDALSFTEAEERINEEMRPFISGEFLVSDIKRAKINELFTNENGDRWYRAKVNFISLDEEKGIEKRIATTMFAQASTLKDAFEVIEKGMKDTLADYDIAAIAETTILDVFPYKAE
ncbi:MAG TPA: DUF4494 domain-containing protein [Paludibacteraceae bacterium]|nr:DUF4494 domain-containing protein [Paludibacteraceae bacterium]HPT42403.1 DUF4494 domain-containing protein [Paludibacteraceae bacterium]